MSPSLFYYAPSKVPAISNYELQISPGPISYCSYSMRVSLFLCFSLIQYLSRSKWHHFSPDESPMLIKPVFSDCSVFERENTDKLDISDEFKNVLDTIRLHNDDKIRCVLNKADCVTREQLVRVYGSLLWSMGECTA